MVSRRCGMSLVFSSSSCGMSRASHIRGMSTRFAFAIDSCAARDFQ